MAKCKFDLTYMPEVYSYLEDLLNDKTRNTLLTSESIKEEAVSFLTEQLSLDIDVDGAVELGEVLSNFAKDYLASFGDKIPVETAKVLNELDKSILIPINASGDINIKDLIERNTLFVATPRQENVDTTKPVTSVDDLFINVFGGNTSALHYFKHEFRKSVLSAAVVNFEEGIIIENSTQLNHGIHKLKLKMLSELAEAETNQEEVSKIMENIDEAGLETGNTESVALVNNLLETIKQKYESFDASKISKLINDRNYKELSLYNNYITLKNFDAILEMYMGNIVDTNKVFFGRDTGYQDMLKYTRKQDVFRFSYGNDNVSIDDELSKIYNLLVEFTPIISFDITGRKKATNDTPVSIKENRYLKSDVVNNTVTKLNQMLPSRKLGTSGLKEKIEYVLFHDKSGLNRDDLEVLSSLYFRFFRSEGNTAPFYSLYQILANKYSVTGDTIKTYLLETISGSIHKTVKKNYTGVVWDTESKSFVNRELKALAINKYDNIVTKGIQNRVSSLVVEDIDSLIKDVASISPLDNTSSALQNNNGYIFTFGDSRLRILWSDTKKNIALEDANGNLSDIELNKLFEDLTEQEWIAYNDRNNSVMPKSEGKKRLISFLEQFGKLTSRNLHLGNGQLYTEVLKQYSNREDALKGLLTLLRNTVLSYDYRRLKEGTPSKTHPFFSGKEDDTSTFIIDKVNGNVPRVNMGQGGIAIKKISAAMAFISGEASKSIVYDANKNALPVYGLINLINDLKTQFEENKNKEEFTSTPISKTLFGSDAGINMIKNIIHRTDVTLQNGKVVPCSKFQAGDTAHVAILYDFYQTWLNSEPGTTMVNMQPTVYADKSGQALVSYDLNTALGMTKTLSKMSNEELNTLHFDTMHGMYSRIGDILLRDYTAIFKKYSEDLLENINRAPEDKVLSLPERILKQNKWLGDFLALGLPIEQTIYNGKSEKKIINEYNTALKMLPESLTMEQTKLLVKYLGKEDLTKYGYAVGINVMDQIHYAGKKGTEHNDLLYHYISLYNNRTAYNSKIARENKRFLVAMERNNVFFQYNEEEKELIDRIYKDIFGTETWQKKWLNKKTGVLKNYILYDKDGKVVDGKITSEMAESADYTVEMNPILAKFQATHQVLSDNFMAISAGGPHAHVFKGKVKNASEEESARLLAQYKRMVIMQGTMHPYIQNNINGMPFESNMAVFDDYVQNVFNTIGNSDEFKVHDGGWFSSGIGVHHMNNSLADVATEGGQHKPIGHHLVQDYNAAVLLKYATFAISNEVIRNSQDFGKTAFRQMHSIDFGPINLFSGIYSVNPDPGVDTFSKILGGNNLKVKYPGEAVKSIIDIKFSRFTPETAFYTISYNNNTSIEVPISNVYQLWEALGGEYSVKESETGEITQGDARYTYSEDSMKNVADIMNSVVIARTKENENTHADLIARLGLNNISYNGNYINVDNWDEFTKNTLADQVTYFQPLKHAIIYQAGPTSGIKNGAQNINPSNIFGKLDKDGNHQMLRHFRMLTSHSGIQMDADHHADAAHLTEMTQVISAAEALGTCHSLVNRLYSDLGKIIELTLDKEYKAIEKAYNGDKDDLYKMITKLLIRSLGSKEKIGLAQTFLSQVQEELKNSGKGDEVAIRQLSTAFSSNSFYGALVSNLASDLNKRAIRRSYSGIAAVINPSHLLIKIHRDIDGNVRMGKEIAKMGNAPEAQIQYSDEIVSGADLNIYDNFVEVDKTGQPISSIMFIDDPEDYYKLQDSDKLYKKVYNNGRDLEGTKTYIKEYTIDENGNKVYGKTYTRLDLLPVKRVYAFLAYNKILKKIHDLQKEIAEYDNSVSEYQKEESNNELISLESKLATFRNSDRYNLIASIFNTGGHTYNKTWTSKVYAALVNDVHDMGNKLDKGLAPIYPDKNDVNVEVVKHNAEIILSKVFKSNFALEDGVTLNEINEEYFANKLNNRVDIPNQYCDFATTSINGVKTLFMNRANFLALSPSERAEFKDFPINTYDEGNSTYRMLENGSVTYPITVDGNPKLLVRKIGNFEVIIYDDLKDAQNVINTQKDVNIIFNVKTGKSETINRNDIISIIKHTQGDKGEADVALLSTSPKEFKKKYERNRTYRNSQEAKKLYASFLKSLEFVAARIPAQSLQSFMASKVVGFIDTDINTVLLPIKKNWLDGSDFDIDKTYLMGYSISENGVFTGWSSHFRHEVVNGENMLDYSTKLPMPDGKIRTVNSVNSEDANLSNEEVELLYIYKNTYKDKNFDRNIFKEFTGIMDKIADLGALKIDKTADKNKVEEVIALINDYFTELPKSEHTMLEAVKNSVVSKLIDVSSSLKNLMAGERPVDMDAPQEAAAGSDKGQQAKRMSGLNYMSIAELMEQNGTGKDVIGISAVGIKVFFALSYYLNDQLRQGKLDKIKVKKVFNLGDSVAFANSLANINFDDLDPAIFKSFEDDLKEFEEKVTKDPSTYNVSLKSLENKIYGGTRYNGDASLVLSALLSAATD